MDVTTDPKIEPAILRYGAAAYAFYFVHLEYCYKSETLSVDVSDTETGAEMREVIQRKLHISNDEYDLILKSLVRHGAFDPNIYQQTGHLTSNGIKKRAGRVLEKRMKDVVRYENSISDSISEVETIVETAQSKAKHSIAKQNKENKSIEKEALMGIEVYPSGFVEFWEAYPRKVKKQEAIRAWKKQKADKLTEVILSSLEIFKRSIEWQKNNGQYIQYPASWLNARRWEDETKPQQSNGGLLAELYHEAKEDETCDAC